MNRIINGNVVDVMEGNRNAEWKVNRRGIVICLCNVDWLSRYNDDWLSEYGGSPWHYSKRVGHPNRIRYYSRSWYLLVLLFDVYDDKEAY